MNLTLATLATYRLTFLLVYEDGPAEAAARWRSYVALNDYPIWVVEGINCMLCVSFWLAWLIALLLPMKDKRDYPLNALGIGGGVLVLHHFVQEGL